MKSQYHASVTGSAGFLPLLAYAILVIVAQGHHELCCAGMPDHGQVAVQQLPTFLLLYRPTSTCGPGAAEMSG